MFSYRTFKPSRVIPLVLLLMALGYGVFFFAKHQEVIANFRPYYYKSYEAAIKYRISHPVAAAINTANTTAVPVLVYHGITPGKSIGEDTSVNDFADQMMALKTAGYHTVSIDEYYKFIYEGKSLPQKSFLLTFDDGRKDSYYASQPLLEAFDFRATMFVITSKSLGDRSSVYYLSKSELKEMNKSGHWDIQVHTRNGHDVFGVDETNKAPFYANKLWLKDQKRLETNEEYRQRVRTDLIGAKQDIKSKLGITPISFAVPFGDIGEGATNYSGAKQALLKEVQTIFPLTFIQFTPGRPYAENYSGSSQELNTRIEPQAGWTTSQLLAAIGSADAKTLPYSTNPKVSDGWLHPWGNTFDSDEGLKIQARTAAEGASSTLDGTYAWDNYTIKTTARISKGEGFKIIMREQENSTFLACVYTATSVSVQQVVGGTTNILATTPKKQTLTKQTDYTTSVKGQLISCGIPGETGSLAVPVPDTATFTTGGIGYLVYDKKVNNSEGVITRVEVTATE